MVGKMSLAVSGEVWELGSTLVALDLAVSSSGDSHQMVGHTYSHQMYCQDGVPMEPALWH